MKIEDCQIQHRLDDRHAAWRQHGIVTADNLRVVDDLAGLPVGGLLFFRNRCRGVPRRFPPDRLAGRDTALEAAVVVAHRNRVPLLANRLRAVAVVERPPVVSLRSRNRPGVGTEAELDVSRRGDRKHRLPEPRGERIEPRCAESARDAPYLEGDRAADRVAGRLIFVYQFPHPLGRLGVSTPDLVVLGVFEHLLEGHLGRFYVADLVDVRLDFDVVGGLFEHLLCDRSGGDPVHRFAGRRAPPAAPVSGSELRRIREIAVTRPRGGDKGFVLAGAGVLVLDDHPDRGTGGVAVLRPGVEPNFVGLAAARRDLRLPRFPAVEFVLDLFFVELDTGRAAGDGDTHRVPVALAVGDDLKEPAESVSVHYRHVRTGMV